MGRYRRGHRHRKGSRNRKQSENGGDGKYSTSPQMIEADWILLEKYLLEYRSRAYDAYRSKEQKIHSQHEQQQFISDPVMIAIHKFLPLTTEICQRPYVELPDTLSARERRRVHALCAELDLYHDSVGGGDSAIANTKANDGTAKSNAATNSTSKRRIAISIFADGLELAPGWKSSRGSDGRPQTFPSSTCQPWYCHAYGKSKNDKSINQAIMRIQTIELEKQQIRQFVSLPEKSLRLSDGDGQSSCDDLDMSVLDSMDLSIVPTPEETPWMLVDSVDKLKTCVHELEYGVGCDATRVPKIHELAFDMEMHNVGEGNSNSTNQSGIRTCLIQLTCDVARTAPNEQGEGVKEVYKDYIIDPLAPGMWQAIPIYLGKLFADPNIVKIGHGIGGMDVSSLHRDFGILIVNAFDTYEASTILNPSKGGLGLASLCRHYGLPRWEHYKELKHTYQCSDWKKRPLDDGALEYGRYDIRYLTTLRKLLMRDLAKLDMLNSGSFRRFGSSVEDDSDFGDGDTPVLNSFDSRLESTVSSATSDNEFNGASSSNSVDQFSGVGTSSVVDKSDSGDVFVDAVDPPLPPSTSGSIIQASEFPCYHQLMKAISLSQKRCLKLWTGDDDEPIMRNPSLLKMIKQAANQKGHGKHWSDVHTQLYVQLAEWRRETAGREFNSVSEVCTLDFLVHVAYKLPKSRTEMRRYSYVLPALIEDETLPYCDELCKLVTSSALFQHQKHQPSQAAIFYSDSCPTESGEKRQSKLLKFLVASTAITLIAVVITRVRKK